MALTVNADEYSMIVGLQMVGQGKYESTLVAVATLWLSLGAQAGYRFDDPGAFLAEASALPAWAETLRRHAAERAAIESCVRDEGACAGKLKALRYVLVRGAELQPDDQLRLVNRYVNKRRYRRDRRKIAPSAAANGEARLDSHWATLLEFLRRGGDCEDYATAKYFLLRELGYPADDMRVVVAFDRRVREHHAVLAIRRGDGSSWLLESDNTIRRSNHRGYRFIFALNEDGIWSHAD